VEMVTGTSPDCLFSVLCNSVLYMLFVIVILSFVSVLKNCTKKSQKRLDVTNKILHNQKKSKELSKSSFELNLRFLHQISLNESVF
jgi:hypothetical protein